MVNGFIFPENLCKVMEQFGQCIIANTSIVNKNWIGARNIVITQNYRMTTGNRYSLPTSIPSSFLSLRSKFKCRLWLVELVII